MPSPFAPQMTQPNPLDGPVPSQPSNNPLDNPQGGQQQPQNSAVPGLPNSTNVPAQQPAADPNKSPLDSFKDVFETKPVGNNSNSQDPNNPEGNNAPAQPEPLDFTKNIPDAKKVSEVFGGKNFLPEGAEDAAQKALKGDTVALLELIQGAVRAGSANAAHVSLAGSAQHMNNNLESLQSQTQSRTQNELRSASLYGQAMQKYPMLNNDVIGPQVKAVIEKFIEKRGTHTDQQLFESISQLLEHSYNVNTSSTEADNQQTSQEQDWLNF